MQNSTFSTEPRLQFPSHTALDSLNRDAHRRASEHERARQDTYVTLRLLADSLKPQRRVVHAGDLVHQAGGRFSNLYILNAGVFKIINISADGRDQVVALKFRGDWLGFDGIASGCYANDAIAIDTGEVWMISYHNFMTVSATCPELLKLLHSAMSREISREQDSMMAICTLPAHARVADFLRYWVEAQGNLGMRTDRITLRMSRSEIGSYLGMTLETVSRALTRLAREKLICFPKKGRRELQIPDVAALSGFVLGALGSDA